MHSSTTQAPPFPDFPNFELIEPIHIGGRTRVYRAVETDSGNFVVIKVLNQDYPGPVDLVRFRNQYVIAKNLEMPGVARPLRFQSVRTTYAVVFEDCGGVPLKEYIQTRSLSISEVLEIGLQLVEILQGLYRHRVIHKDIKPSNILIHPDSHKITLIDFSIASILPKAIQEITSPSQLEGTLAYLAPEQTGRMNRGIDFRADYYAVGVTLYELLTGQLPFTSTDPLELIHCHIAKPATPVNQLNPEIPAPVAAIIHKLMAKNAEDRYQSTLGIKHDLATCLSQWNRTGRITAFDLGTQDKCDRFLIPETLYGRENEVQTLLKSFERVIQGRAELVLVAGSSGIGKTAVINEVHKPITQQKGYFIKGKFDQFNRDLPFSAFIQALRNLVEQILGESDEQLEQWKTKILEAVGQNGKLLTQAVPELERVIGPQPDVEALDGSASLNRFNRIFSQFVQVFCAQTHPLVVFLDDLQWADSGSLHLLKLLISNPGTRHLLILGAYRDNEVSAAHPLTLTLSELEAQQSTIHTLTLGSLTQSDLSKLVANSLLCAEDAAAPLAALIFQKTQGNPFFSIQFLKELQDKGHITLADSGQWEYDLTQVKQLALTDDVVSLMILRLSQLPDATQRLLKRASCIGNQFELETLAAICERSQADIAEELWPVLKLGLVLSESRSPHPLQPQDTDSFDLTQALLRYRFLHDKVQQAVYSLIPASEKERTHYQIGQLLLNNLSAQQKKEKFFEIVNQLNFGLSLISDPAKKETLAQFNLKAGKRAKASTAYAAASKYLRVARDIILSIGWDQNYKLALEIYQELVEVSYLNTDFEQFDIYFNEAIAQTRSLLDQIKFYEIQINSYLAQNQLLKSVQTGLAVLKELDSRNDIPQDPDFSDFQRALMQTQQNLGDRPIHELIELPEMSDPAALAAVNILVKVMPSAYVATPSLFPFMTMKLVNLSIASGNASGSAIGYSTFGLLNCAKLGEIKTGYQFGRLALSIIDKFNAKPIEAMVVLTFAIFIQHWQEPIQNSLQNLESVVSLGIETGDFANAGYATSMYCYIAFFSNSSLKSLRDKSKVYRETVLQLKQTPPFHLICIIQQAIQNLMEGSDSPQELIGAIYDERDMLPQHVVSNDRIALAIVFLTKLSLSFFFNDYDAASAASDKAKEYSDGILGTPCIAALNFFDSLTKLAQARQPANDNKRDLLEAVQENQSSMKRWADHAPFNNLHRFYLLEAESARTRGNLFEALEQYDRAIATARENHRLNEEALANELAAQFYLDWGKERVAAGYLQEAYTCYFRWGAKAKTEQLLENYPELLRPVAQSPTASLEYIDALITDSKTIINDSTHSTHSSRNSLSEALDLSTVIQSAQILSSSLELNTLIARLMHLMIYTAGAETCALVVPEVREREQTQSINHTIDWFVQRLESDISETNLSSAQLDSLALMKPKSLSEDRELPLSLINYVKRSGKVVQVDDLNHQDMEFTDDYLRVHRPKSVLVHPIFHQEVIVGVLYLENRRTAQVFHPQQRKVIAFFCNQAGIALENARLYKIEADQAQALLLKNQELNKAKHAAESANQAKSRFLQHMSHELMTPLNGIHGNTQILHRSKTLSDSDLHKLNRIQECSHQLQSLIGNIRDICQMDHQNFVLNPKETNLDICLKSLITQFQTLSLKKGLEFNHYVSPKLPQWVFVDEMRLRQVLVHLLDNAIKYTHRGSVEFKIEVLSEHETATTINFSVADTGTGIKKADWDSLFQRFEQGDNIVNSAGGLGMGLSISQHIVQQMGGSITLDSSPDVGSIFQFTIQLEIIQHTTQNIDSPTLCTDELQVSEDINDRLQLPQEIAVPKTELLQALLSLSRAGRLQQIKTLLEEQIQTEPNLKSFSDPLLELASRFEVEKIETVLLQYLELELEWENSTWRKL